MTAGAWATLIVTIADLIVAVAAMPSGANRKALISVPSQTTPPAKFDIRTPQQDQRVSMTGGTVVNGTIGTIGSAGKRASTAATGDFENKPIGDEIGQTATITVVRANSDCNRLRKAVKPDSGPANSRVPELRNRWSARGRES